MCSQVCKFCEERIFLKMWFVFSEKGSCEQSGVNTIESLQGLHPLIVRGNVGSSFIYFSTLVWNAGGRFMLDLDSYL